MRTKDNSTNGQLLLTINNAIVKNELISAVIQKDKKNGVSKFLTKRHANLLYQLRCLRKKYQGKIFSCFSRHGYIYYKLTQEASPIIISGQAEIDHLTSELEKGAIPTARNLQEVSPQSPPPRNQRVNSKPQTRSQRK